MIGKPVRRRWDSSESEPKRNGLQRRKKSAKNRYPINHLETHNAEIYRYKCQFIKPDPIIDMQKFLLELDQGFAFVGQQVHLELGDQDFYLDLLFYHLKLRRYIVVELKARKFEAGDGAQLGMYMHAVDKLLCDPS